MSRRHNRTLASRQLQRELEESLQQTINPRQPPFRRPRTVLVAIIALLVWIKLRFWSLHAPPDGTIDRPKLPTTCISHGGRLPLSPAWARDALTAAWAVANKPEVLDAWITQSPFQSVLIPQHFMYLYTMQRGYYEAPRLLANLLRQTPGLAWWSDSDLEQEVATINANIQAVERLFNTGTSSSMDVIWCHYFPETSHCYDRTQGHFRRVFYNTTKLTESIEESCHRLQSISSQEAVSLAALSNKTASVRKEVWEQLHHLLEYSGQHNSSSSYRPTGLDITITDENGRLSNETRGFLDGLSTVYAQSIVLDWMALTISHRYSALELQCSKLDVQPFTDDLGSLFDQSDHANADLEGLRIGLYAAFVDFQGSLPSLFRYERNSRAPTNQNGLSGAPWPKTPIERGLKAGAVLAACRNVMSQVLTSEESDCVHSFLHYEHTTSSLVQRQIWDYWWHQADPHFHHLRDMGEEFLQDRHKPLQDSWPRLDHVQPYKAAMAGLVHGR